LLFVSVDSPARRPRAIKPRSNDNESAMTRHRPSRRTAGYTLLEMLIAAAVIVILLMIALPSYQAQMRRSHRASAESHLMDIAARQQQYLFDNRSYAPDLATLNMTTPADVAGSYTISIATASGPPPSFTLTATPTGSQTLDLGGAALTLSNTGAKTPVGAW
jgi:type IV pilus assembly protein PilE